MSGKIRKLSAHMMLGKIELVENLKVEIVRSGVSSKNLFSDLMKVVFGKQVGLDRRMLADDLGFSYGSVCRWASGRSVPDPALWPKVTAWVESSLDKKRDELRALLAA